jgi:hypothetical protein
MVLKLGGCSVRSGAGLQIDYCLRGIVFIAEACWILVVVVQAGTVADVRVDIRIGGLGWLRVSRPFVLTTSGSWWRAPSTESAASAGSGPVAASSRCGLEDGGGCKSRSSRKNRSVCACRACERQVPVAAA